VVEQLSHHLKVKDLNPVAASATGREREREKMYFKQIVQNIRIDERLLNNSIFVCFNTQLLQIEKSIQFSRN
jgi:hypothetical protein